MKLEEIRKLIEAATPGPWRYDHGNQEVETRIGRWNVCDIDMYRQGRDPEASHPGDRSDDGEFIAASRTLMPRLLAVAEAAAKLDLWGSRGEDSNYGAELTAAIANLYLWEAWKAKAAAEEGES